MNVESALIPARAAAACTMAGLCLAFPGMPVSLPLLVLLYPLGAALLGLGAISDRQAFGRAWAAASCGHALTLYWLCVPMSRVGGLPVPAAIACALLVCLVLATQAAVFAVVCRRLWRPIMARSALAMGLCWYFLEWIYALVAGFPWLPLSGALAPWTWTMQAADVLGATLTGSLWAAAALALGGGVLARRPRCVMAGALLALCLSGYGVLITSLNPVMAQNSPGRTALDLPVPDPDPDAFPVLLVEGNIDQNQKWEESFRQNTVNTYVSLTSAALDRAIAGADTTDNASRAARALVIWPETAMPFNLPSSRHTLQLMELTRQYHVPLLTGAPAAERAPDGSILTYNRLWLLNEDGLPAGSYDKEHLVPFGEYVPSFFRWNFLAGLLQQVGAYAEGTRTAPLHMGRLALGPLICYEAVFPWLAQDRVEKGANVLVDVSNDAWFGDTAAPWQHLALTGLRALEQNRWLVRCTNSGISAVFDNRGRLVFQGPQFQAGALWASARITAQTSSFHNVFYILPAICALLCAGLIWSTTRKEKKHAAT